MTYDFSKAQVADIITLRDRTADALAKNPSSENAAEWKAYIDQANAELARRPSTFPWLYVGLAVVAGWFLLKRRR
jgi:hypothetical protein